MGEGAPHELQLDLAGFSVSRIAVDYAFILHLVRSDSDAMDQKALLTVEAAFDIGAGGVAFHCDPGTDPVGLGPALGLLHRTIEAAAVDADATLHLAFEGGARMVVSCDLYFESWNLNSPHGLTVAGPGDRVTTFPPSQG